MRHTMRATLYLLLLLSILPGTIDHIGGYYYTPYVTPYAPSYYAQPVIVVSPLYAWSPPYGFCNYQPRTVREWRTSPYTWR